MERRKKNYVSLFKIDNVPILPPLMTDEKQREMLRYKELALALETKLKLDAEPQNSAVPEKLSNELIAEKPHKDEYQEISNLLEEKTKDTVVKVLYRKEEDQQNKQRLVNLQKSDTFIYDIITNTVIIPYDSDYVNECRESHQKESPNETNKVKSSELKERERNLPSAKMCHSERNSTQLPSKESPLRNTIADRVPLISIKPPTPESKATLSQEAHSSALESKSDNKTPESKTNTYRIDSSNIPESKLNNSYKCEAERVLTPRRSTTSPSLKTDQQFTPTLIRSNSFTLESPSNALLQHMATQWGTLEPEIKPTPDKIISDAHFPLENNAKGKMKVAEVKAAPTKLKEVISPAKYDHKAPPKINTLLITNSTMYKNNKSPYDVKLCGRTKLLKKHKSPVVRTISAISIKHRSRHSSKKGDKERSPGQTCSSDPKNISEVFKGMDATQKLRLMELIKRQEEERRCLQETFEKQQRMLLQELANSTDTAPSDYEYFENNYSRPDENTNAKLIEESAKHTAGPNKQEDFLPSTKNAKIFPSNKVISNVQNFKEYAKLSPRRRLFSDDHSIKYRERPVTPAKRREKAVITLQAYVRGFLVRRLFRTKHVQKCVQTIRDTLLFVLELHMETRYDDSEENIRLKARLLQQLSSSSQALHKIFFETSIKERMNIIRKDRLFALTNSARSPRKQ